MNLMNTVNNLIDQNEILTLREKKIIKKIYPVIRGEFEKELSSMGEETELLSSTIALVRVNSKMGA